MRRIDDSVCSDYLSRYEVRAFQCVVRAGLITEASFMTSDDPLDLNLIRKTLIRLEDTIIFCLSSLALFVTIQLTECVVQH